MPNAKQTNLTLAAFWLEQAFIDKLMLALTACGFPTPYDYQPGTATGTNRYIVYEMLGDSTKAKGKIYLRIRWTITSVGVITLFSTLFDTWSTVNRAGTNMGTEVTCSITLNPLNASDFYAFNHPEIKQLLINQGSNWGYLNFIKPANKIMIGTTTIFDEANVPYGFISSSSDLMALLGVAASLSPTGDTNYSLDRPSELANRNTATNRVQVIPAPKVYTGISNQGVVAQFSTDVGICASNGMSQMTEVNDPGNTTFRRVLMAIRTSSGLVLNCDPVIAQG